MSLHSPSPTLRELLTDKKRGESFTADQAVWFIEFQPNPERREGFALAQLLHYVLDANPAAASGKEEEAPPERLTLAFSTADVVVLGWRLVALTAALREHKLGFVRAVSGRYSNLEQNQPHVAEIVIQPPGKS